MNNIPKCKVIGAGPSGLLLSLALSRINIIVDVYEANILTDLSNIRRTYAITHSTRKLLEKLYLWDSIFPYLHHFSCLNVVDQALTSTARFSTNDLLRSNREYSSLGWTISHSDLYSYLLEKVNQDVNINIYDNTNTSPIDNLYDYCFAADGSSSSSRSLLNIPSISFAYNQGCIVTKILLRGIDNNTAFEIFKIDGPLAILPLKDGIFQILWTTSLEKCNSIINLPMSRFLDLIASILPFGLEPDCVIQSPKVIPLDFNMATSLSSNNVFLVGESSHKLHPIGGQGFNLSVRDINSIFRLFKYYHRDFSISRLSLFVYNLERSFDIFSMSLLTNLLLFLFSRSNYIVILIRSCVFRIILKKTIFKRILFSIMTDGPSHFFNSV